MHHDGVITKNNNKVYKAKLHNAYSVKNILFFYSLYPTCDTWYRGLYVSIRSSALHVSDCHDIAHSRHKYPAPIETKILGIFFIIFCSLWKYFIFIWQFRHKKFHNFSENFFKNTLNFCAKHHTLVPTSEF